MSEQTQKEFLLSIKTALDCTWDDLALRAGIKPRALKTYRMPDESLNFRTMNDLARNALIRVLEDQRNKKHKYK